MYDYIAHWQAQQAEAVCQKRRSSCCEAIKSTVCLCLSGAFFFPLSAHSARTHSCVIKRKLKTERDCVGCCVFGLCHLAVMSQKHPVQWRKRKDLVFEGLHVLPRFCGVLPQPKVKVRTIFRVVVIGTGGWQLSETRKTCTKTFVNQLVNMWHWKQRHQISLPPVCAFDRRLADRTRTVRLRLHWLLAVN